jgi:hypothetical protein
MGHNKVTRILGRFVADYSATGAAGLIAIGHRLGCFVARGARAGGTRAVSPSGPAAAGGTSASARAASLPAAT